MVNPEQSCLFVRLCDVLWRRRTGSQSRQNGFGAVFLGPTLLSLSGSPPCLRPHLPSLGRPRPKANQHPPGRVLAVLTQPEVYFKLNLNSSYLPRPQNPPNLCAVSLTIPIQRSSPRLKSTPVHAIRSEPRCWLGVVIPKDDSVHRTFQTRCS
jgi:hypothetical protein